MDFQEPRGPSSLLHCRKLAFFGMCLVIQRSSLSDRNSVEKIDGYLIIKDNLLEFPINTDVVGTH